MLVIDCPGYSTTAGRYIESRGFRATVISTTLGQEKRRAANEIRTRVERTYQSSFSNGPAQSFVIGSFRNDRAANARRVCSTIVLTKRREFYRTSRLKNIHHSPGLPGRNLIFRHKDEGIAI